MACISGLLACTPPCRLRRMYEWKGSSVTICARCSCSEIIYVLQVIFAKLIAQQYECNSLKGSKKTDAANVTTAIEEEIEEERRSKDKELMQLNVQHSEDISGLPEIVTSESAWFVSELSKHG